MEENPSTSAPTPTQPVQAPPSTNYAGFGRRLLAYWIDGLIVFLLSLSIGFTVNNGSVSWLPGTILGAAYYIFFWMKQDGQTLGKKLLAIKIVREDGHPIDFTTGIVRYIGYLISGLVFSLGFLWMLWDGKKQTWHDKMAKTLVVKTDAKPRYFLALLAIVIPMILFILVIAGIGAAGYLLYKNNPQALKDIEKTVTSQITVTQTDAARLAAETFEEVNDYRKEKSLAVFAEDSKLCAYAQRRLEQLNALNRYDDGKGFYEDSTNKSITTTYFSEYTNVGETWHEVTALTTGERVVSDWSKSGKESDRTLDTKTYNAACVRSDTEFVVMIAGSRK